jgi:hypothetical protein
MENKGVRKTKRVKYLQQQTIEDQIAKIRADLPKMKAPMISLGLCTIKVLTPL